MAAPKDLAMLILTDSIWGGSEVFPNRGIYDYNRRLEFTRPLTPAEIEQVKEWLRNDNCPGWTGISARPEHYHQWDDTVWFFSTTMDSSD